MTELVLASAFFLGIHVVISGTRLRDALVARTGERAFQGLFSLLSLVGIIWLVRAYSAAPQVPLWVPLPWFRPIALVLMLLAALLVTVGVTTPSPTAAGGESALESDDPARGILRVTRHPFLCGVAIWAITHVLATGDVASLLLFGSLLLLCVIGPLQIDAKRARRFPERWKAFAAVTSIVPFAAIAAGRNSLELRELALWRVALGLSVFLLLLWLHPRLFGVSPLSF